ncbi:MAG: His-Xaa-Ser system protein HxsD [Polyangiales bacterium]
MDGFPSDIVAADPTTGGVTITVSSSVYPLEAVYGAAYIFLDRCYVLLDRPSETSLSVTLAAKRDASPEALRALTGEFANELLSQAWRLKILDENRAILETVTAQALAGAMGPPPEPAAPSLDELASFDFSDEGFDDPLGIAMSWEEKYKKKPEGDTAAAKPEGQS